MPLESTIFIVDDDDAVRDSLSLLMQSVGLKVAAYASGQEFLDAYTVDKPGCLLLDIRMPGMSGIEVQEVLREKHSTLPIIFITGHGDIPMAVNAIRRGAADFIPKPFRDQELLDRIESVLKTASREIQSREEQTLIRQRLENLTERETEVMRLMVDGKANKVIASELEISQRTIEVHRARVMEKTQAHSIAELVRMVMQAEYQGTSD